MKLNSKQYGLALYKLTHRKSEHEMKSILHAFARFLFSNGDTSKVKDVVRFYDETKLKAEGRIRSRVRSAYGDENVLPRHMHGTELYVEQEKDPNLVAGITVDVGDLRIENSIDKPLPHFKTSLN